MAQAAISAVRADVDRAATAESSRRSRSAVTPFRQVDIATGIGTPRRSVSRGGRPKPPIRDGKRENAIRIRTHSSVTMIAVMLADRPNVSGRT